MSVPSQHTGPTTTQPSHDKNPLSPQEKTKAGASWIAAEQHVLPYNRLWIVFPGLMACIFMAALVQTIVGTATPTIVEHLGGGKNYSWVGSAYLLAASAVSPLCGKLSDLFGRKPVLYSAILIFLLGSALCGAAQSMTWLIICRAIQGIGGGGIIQLVETTIADIVSLQDRGKYAGLLGATWGIAGLVGPLLGGVLSDRASWRWCFWINLPTGGIAGVILFFFLNLNPHQGMSLRQHLSQFDFLGLALLISGVVCVLIGLNKGGTSWSSAETIALLCVGSMLLVLAAINEILTTRSPIIPPRLFKTRTTGIILITCFLHAVTFFAGAFYLPLYFQVLGSSATGAGIRMIPYSLGNAAVSTVAGITVTRLGAYRGIIWTSWGVLILGWGLMTTLDDHSNTAEKVLYLLIAAVGIGCLFQTPLIALQAAMPLKDMATSTGAFNFLRTVGGAVGISIGQAIYTSILKRKIDRIPNLSGFDTSPAALARNARKLQHLPVNTFDSRLFHAYAQSISAIWAFNTPVVGVGFIMVLFIKAYSLKRNTIQRGARARPDQEMAVGDTTAGAGADAWADASDGKSEGHEQSLKGGAREQDHGAVDVIDEKKRADGLEKV
ncbi:MFS general substrate transporter [Lactarius psammicola]|nr:MFS general substrate transporter [Lactarius psammicola]